MNFHRIACRVQMTQELQPLLRKGNGDVWQILHAGNGHCLYLTCLYQLRLDSYSPVDMRRALGAWMLLNQDELLPGGITLSSMIRSEHRVELDEYVLWLVDPVREEHDNKPGRRNFAQGTDIEFSSIARCFPDPTFPPSDCLGEIASPR